MGVSHPPGLIAVPVQEYMPAAFVLKLVELVQRLPAGSRVLFNALGGEVARKRNQLVNQMLQVPAFAWLLFLDSDQRVSADTVERLLAHDLPIVGALVVKKRPPAVACVRPPEGDEVPDTIPHLEGLGDRVGSWGAGGVHQCTGRLRLGGLQPVQAIGTGCLLVRRIVFETLPRPWFVSERDADGAGTGEDFSFCRAAAAAGFPSYCDTDLVSGHFTMVAMTPALAAVLPAEAFTSAEWPEAGA